jgi:hypothetical protein
MEGFGFRLVCTSCLATRGVLDSEELPEVCPECGAAHPWSGPYATTRLAHEQGDHLIDSPFYMAASRKYR